MPAHLASVVLVVDFDHQTDDVRALKAQSQSTLIAYKGPEEIARSVARQIPATSKRACSPVKGG